MIRLRTILFESGHGLYTYAGTCKNSFTSSGRSKIDAFYDEQDFFNAWDTGIDISRNEFWNHIDRGSEKYAYLKRCELDTRYTTKYKYSPRADMYMIFVNDDTHYFFIK